MSDRIDALLVEYRRQLDLPWSTTVAGAQRVWIAVYAPALERRLRQKLREFEIETRNSGHSWIELDLTSAFAEWLAANEYREEYFAEPELLAAALSDLRRAVADRVRTTLSRDDTDENTVIALIGAGALFPMARVSEIIDMVSSGIRGRLLVMFPGQVEGSNYRLLDARDGWNYLAVLITAGVES